MPISPRGIVASIPGGHKAASSTSMEIPWGFPEQMENNGKPIRESKIARDLSMNHGAFRQQALELLADLFL